MQSFILILLALVSIAAACPGLFGMMGGGGGGCGCRPPPPPSPCGCGGRKKRSLPEKPPFYLLPPAFMIEPPGFSVIEFRNFPPPPPSPCGCGGRKKRSLPDKPAAPEFFGIAASDKDELCNNSDLKKIILENMQSSPTDSSKAINGALEVKKLSRFTVVCSENPFVFTIRADTAYCGSKKNGHTCNVFSM
ncbi:hypothetical protein CRE_08783 [Caenorhabditis remanei]|uniref:Ground-like domain-containing protein n=1 Tax=Caenorhabditis remanei TaxID=31234 RepID=E3LHH7_CAERE|nr:hypothetical protein CRE_08783 [Caenorhabditis remanei]